MLLSEAADKVVTVLEVQKQHSLQLSEILNGTSAMATFADQYSQAADRITTIIQMLAYLPDSSAEIETISMGMKDLQTNAKSTVQKSFDLHHRQEELKRRRRERCPHLGLDTRRSSSQAR